jgi:hypothetical protein
MGSRPRSAKDYTINSRKRRYYVSIAIHACNRPCDSIMLARRNDVDRSLFQIAVHQKACQKQVDSAIYSGLQSQNTIEPEVLSVGANPE